MTFYKNVLLGPTVNRFAKAERIQYVTEKSTVTLYLTCSGQMLILIVPPFTRECYPKLIVLSLSLLAD